MLKKRLTYENFDGEEVTETLHFYLSRSKAITMLAGKDTNVIKEFTDAAESGDPEKLMGVFRTLIEMSYGIRSADGKRFRQTKEEAEAFMESAALDAFIGEIARTPDDIVTFFNEIMPKDLMRQAASEMEKLGLEGLTPKEQNARVIANIKLLSAPADEASKQEAPAEDDVIEGVPVDNIPDHLTLDDLSTMTPEDLNPGSMDLTPHPSITPESHQAEKERSGLQMPLTVDGSWVPWAFREPTQKELTDVNKAQLLDVMHRRSKVA